jgi:hypothetical protein
MDERYEQGWNEALQAVWQRVFPWKDLPVPLDLEVLDEAIADAMHTKFLDGCQAESEAQSW